MAEIVNKYPVGIQTFDLRGMQKRISWQIIC